MKIKLSATFEGKCDICRQETVVFSAGDEDSKKIVTVCKDCSDRLGTEKLSDVIEKYGHEDKAAFESGVKIEGKQTAE